MENEFEILEDLLSIFNDMMDNLGDADLDDRYAGLHRLSVEAAQNIPLLKIKHLSSLFAEETLVGMSSWQLNSNVYKEVSSHRF